MLLVFVVVPAALRHKLSKNFNGGLRTIRLNLRHVQVIDKDNALHAEAGTESTHADLVELAIDNVLHLVAMSLSGETNLNNQVLLTRQCVQEHILNVDRLASTGRSNNESGDVLIDAVLLQVGVADLVHSCHNDVLNLRVFGELVDVFFVGKVHPRLPVILLREVHIVENCATVHNTRHDLAVVELLDVVDLAIADFLHLEVDGSAVLRVHHAADRPNKRPQEATVNNRDVGLLIVLFHGSLILKYLKLGAPKLQHSVNNALLI